MSIGPGDDAGGGIETQRPAGRRAVEDRGGRGSAGFCVLDSGV